MARVFIDDAILQNLAAAIRDVTGETRTYTPTEMIEAVTNIMDSATYILVDEDGNEYPAVYVDSNVVFTATDNDVREGMIYASDSGVSTGTKTIPAYHTHTGHRAIMPGEEFTHKGEHYDYTKLQAIICNFNTKISDSVATEKSVINGLVYAVESVEPLSSVTINTTNESIDFGIMNDTDEMKVLRYFYFKEEY